MCGVATQVRGRCHKDNNVVRIGQDVKQQSQNWHAEVKMSIVGSILDSIKQTQKFPWHVFNKNVPQCSGSIRPNIVIDIYNPKFIEDDKHIFRL